MLQRFVDELINKYVIPFATVDEKVLSVGIRNGQVHGPIILVSVVVILMPNSQLGTFRVLSAAFAGDFKGCYSQTFSFR
jgi:hypothetical protein